MSGRGSHYPSDLTIQARVNAGAIARKAVTVWLGDHPRLDDVLLAVTELVNNAVVHGGLHDGDALSLSMTSSDDHVRLTVSHTGRVFEARPPASASMDPDASRGLAIVGQIADRWGIDCNGSEVLAWIELSPGLTHYSKG